MKLYDGVIQNIKEYYNGEDDLAASVLANKYLIKNSNGEYKEDKPEDLFNRICNEFYRIEQTYSNPTSLEEIHNSIDHFKYIIPQGSPLAGIGNHEQITSVSNCFVVEEIKYDSYSDIFRADEQIAQIAKRRGGVGLDISGIRPFGSPVKNAALFSDGIKAFMERYSNTIKEVAQSGRRGALMLSISCKHPDIQYFIDAKSNHSKVNGANISIRWSNEFFDCLKNDKPFTLQFPVNVPVEEAKIVKEIDPKEIWNSFVKNNWADAEPGCLFWDTIVKDKTIGDLYPQFLSTSCNPCGEQSLPNGGSCILITTNFSSFIQSPFENPSFDEDLFKKQIRIGVRMIDNLIDIEMEKVKRILDKIDSDPEPTELKSRERNIWNLILQKFQEGRKVGLGVTGLGDMVAFMNLKYGSPESKTFIEKVMKVFHETIYDEQANLAKERGPFKIWNWEIEKNSHYIKILPIEIQEKIKKYGRRNVTCSTISPAGSVSLVAQISSGIEPIFKRSYTKRKKITEDEIKNGVPISEVDSDGISWTEFSVDHPGVKKWKKIFPNKDIKESPYWGVEAGELNWKDRIDIQSICQTYIDSSISSTCNLAENITEEEISKLYLYAFERGLKGVTIFREGSRRGVMISKDKNEKNEIVETASPKRPKDLSCDIHYSNIQGQEWIVFVGLLSNHPYELFGGAKRNVHIPKKYKSGWLIKNGRHKETKRRTYDLYLGSLEESEERMIIKDIGNEFSADSGSYTRLVSTMLRHGVPIRFICEQLTKDSGASLFSFEKCIARILKKYIKDGEKASCVCEQCDSNNMIYQNGCALCQDCGWSKCG